MQKQDGSYKSTTYIDGIFEHTRESISAAAYAIPNLEIGQWTIGVYDQGTAIPDLEIGQWIIGQYGGSTTEQNTLHIMDDQSRIATIRLGDAMGDITPAIKYNLEDHLGSSSIQLDTNGTLVNSEEYYPFGETSFGSYGKKRYRFCGKEKDEESGLYYYGMRYYSAWTCRFINIDPLAAKFPFYTPYQYSGNNPITFYDLDGQETSDNDNTGTPTNGQQDHDVNEHGEAIPKTVRMMRGNYGEGEKIKVAPTSKEPASTNLTEIELYQFALLRYLEPGQHLIGENQYIDETFETAESEVQYFFGHNVPAYSSSEEGTKVAHESTLAGLLSSDPIQNQQAVEQIQKQRNLSYFIDYGSVLGMLIGPIKGKAAAPKVAASAELALKEYFSKLNVWNYIKSTQPVYKGTVIPKSFELTTAKGSSLWVHPNATKHIAQDVHRSGISGLSSSVRSQISLNSLRSAVNQLETQGGIKLGEMHRIGNWELKFSAPRQAGDLPVLYHARPIR
ncbi:RHS repeat-associated core domain-containing protein [Cytophagaceae bacterium ABcell3]|nr:RHS repeat-associated core domain-containing protein [Cytophagaceae bacterium ABcell3]